MPVNLPDVTIVIVDSVEPRLVQLALEDTLREINPAAVMLFGDAHSLDDVTRILWYEVPQLVKTSHFLIMQWDGWVLDGKLWNPKWLELDYIGAPWGWYNDRLKIGNGGFSLRSREMTNWVSTNASAYPIGHPEDDVLCRKYRCDLELDGFRWATLDQATAFSFERSASVPTFGFHGAWNWPSVMDRDRLLIRLEAAGDYARGKPEWQQLMTALGSAPSSLPATRTPIPSAPS